MSVSRDVIAKAYGVPESDVRCSNCVCAKRWINDTYICRFWEKQRTAGSDFCSFWSFLKETKDE